MNIASTLASANYDLPQVSTSANRLRAQQSTSSQSVKNAERVYDAFSKFVGETFYGQMTKSMRSTVDKPAYFHGGRGEEVFQSQLDQQLAQEWAEQSGDRFAEPMFEQAFPEHAQVLREARQAANVAETKNAPSLQDLNGLRRY